MPRSVLRLLGRTLLTGISVAIACLGALRAEAALPYVPASTTIAILPIINQGNSSDDLKGKQTDKAQAELALQFARRGFVIVDPTAVASAVSKSGINFTDEEEQRKDNFYRIGHLVHANLVAFLVIEDTSQGWKTNNMIGNQREGKAHLKFWLVNADQEQPILNDVKVEAKSASNALFAGYGGSEFTVRAVGNGVNDLLKDFFQAYPVVTDTPSVRPPAPQPVAATAPSRPIIPAAFPVRQPVITAPLRLVSPTPPPKSGTQQMFLLKDNTRVYGSLLRYNGFFFWVVTSHGTKKIGAHNLDAISTIYANDAPSH